MPISTTAKDVENAYQTIKSHIKNTPLIASQTLSDICQCRTLFKLENFQMTGSFKERGAANKLLSLTDTEKSMGVIAASAGNHAQALAYLGKKLGISVKIVMPRYSPIVKIKSTEYWGAEVVLSGDTFDEALATSLEIAEREKRQYIHPFDDPLVIAGQGTIGVELINDHHEAQIDAVIVPVGGGGLIAGIATYLKATAPDIRIIGVEEASCDGMYQALQTGAPTMVPAAPVIADGIAVREVSPDNLRVVNELVDEIVTVTSDEIANAIMLMLEVEKLVVEGAAAAPLAALVNNRLPGIKGKTAVSIVSGGNIDVTLLSRVIDQGLAFDGRVACLETVIRDRPGNLEALLGVFREAGANILEVNHQRHSPNAPIGQVAVGVTLETRDQAHLDAIRASLIKGGYTLNI